MKNQQITKSFINGLSYPDFIGFINQWNTPPGALVTLSKFATFSGLNKSSRLLDVGCSTGFNSRELSVLSGCGGIGFDISQRSVEMARYNLKIVAPKSRFNYQVSDGESLRFKQKFTHIVTAENIKFFKDPELMLQKCATWLGDGGYILASPYFQVRAMPQKLVSGMHRQLGIPLKAFKNFSYKDVMDLYNKFEIVYEDKQYPVVETSKELEYYAESVIDGACALRSIKEPELRECMKNKLLGYRKLINESRKYQGFTVLVLRYRKSFYPKRLIALF